jgi:hypothetical protein
VGIDSRKGESVPEKVCLIGIRLYVEETLKASRVLHRGIVNARG